MANPPTSVPASELFIQLCSMPRPNKVVDFPRADPITKEPSCGKLVMQVLTEAEHIACSVAAERVAREALKGDMPKEVEAKRGYDDIYNNAGACEILYRACLAIEDPKFKTAFFPSPNEMRRVLTNDEIGVLMSAYRIVQAELGPIISEMTEDEVDAWIKVIGEGGSRLPFALLSSGGLESLAFILVRRAWTSSTATPSAGSPPDGGLTDT